MNAGASTLNVAALAIAVGAGVALLRYKVGMFTVLGGAVAAGLAATFAGLA